MQKKDLLKTCRNVKRQIALGLALVLGISALSGCGRQEESLGQIPVEKGRYVEKEVALPEGLAVENIVQIFGEDGKLHLLSAAAQEEGTKLQEWQLADGKVEEITPEWLKQFPTELTEYGSVKLLKNGETSYIYATYAEGEDYKAHLWKSTDGMTSEEVTPKPWQEINEEWGFYDTPSDVAVLENGMLLGMFYDRIEQYQEDGTRVNSIPLSAYVNSNALRSRGNRFYMLGGNEMQEVTGVEIWDEKSSVAVSQIPFTLKSNSYAYFDVLKDGSIVLACGDGIFKCSEGSTQWEQLIAGVDTSFALNNMWVRSMAALEDGSCYALMASEDGTGTLFSYVYDPEAEILPTQVLKLYTVHESFLLQQAAVMFHKQNPSVIVEVETAVSYEDMYMSNPDYQQIYQDLNTRLMAGEGPDILVMDKLDMDSFVEKGLLSDINDVVAPLEENGALLKNITGSYLADGKRYAVPLQFSIVLALGRELNLENMLDLESVAKVMADTTESLMGDRTAEELVDEWMPYFKGELIKDKKLDKEVLKENLEYLKSIADNCGYVEKRADDSWQWNAWELASYVKYALYETEGFNGAMLPVSLVNLVKGEFGAFDNGFSPLLEMGINSQSKQQELAKEFLAFALSEEIQNHDYYQGFPVNAASLEVQSKADRSNAEAYTMIEVGEGMSEEFAIKSYSEEEAAKLMDICKGVSKRLTVDDKIKEEIVYALPEYLKGNRSVEETVDEIEAALRMYLAE